MERMAFVVMLFAPALSRRHCYAYFGRVRRHATCALTASLWDVLERPGTLCIWHFTLHLMSQHGQPEHGLWLMAASHRITFRVSVTFILLIFIYYFASLGWGRGGPPHLLCS